jgi:hypothetical protein
MAKAAKKAETSTPMDYAEHERTYANFLWLTKWGIAGNVALLIAMAFGFFGGFGLFGGILIFLILVALAYFFV